MSSPGVPKSDRLYELLADRALVGLSHAEETEYSSLLRHAPDITTDELELAAAALDLALMPAVRETMPAALRAKVAADAAGWMARHASIAAPQAFAPRAATPAVAGRIDQAPSISRGSPIFGALGWLAAAAALALAAAAWWGQPGSQLAGPADPFEQRQALLASASDLTRWDWQSLGEFEKSPVRGEAIWSSSKRQGFMTFKGLKVNDPKREQYQLWIFDPSQSDKTPIDGGVFDATAESEIVVPIDPKLTPAGPVMFAITIEKPGGVVVSDRSRLVLIAKAG